MIIYGRKSTHLITENLSEKCPSCGTANSLRMSVYQKYAHLFWIPSFPIGKTGVSECSHCKQVLELKEMPASLKQNYNTLKQHKSTPVWTFSGLALFAALITAAVISGNRNSEENKAFAQAPQKGDVYEVKTKNNQYTLMKVSEVKGDSVFVLQHQYETNKATGLSQLKSKGDTAYVPEAFPLLKAEIVSMLDKGEIIDVERK